MRNETTFSNRVKLTTKFAGACAALVLSLLIAPDALAFPGRPAPEYNGTLPRSNPYSSYGDGGVAGSVSQCGSSGYDEPISNLRVTSCFAQPRSYGGQRYSHQGLDVNGPSSGAGAQIKAIAAGRVRTAGRMGGRSGNTLVMDHPNCPKPSLGSSCVSVYRHMARRFLVGPGQCAQMGQGLGYVGQRNENGGVPPHLHLEIIANGVAYNPAAFTNIIHDEHKCRTDMQSVGGRTPANLWNTRPRGGHR